MSFKVSSKALSFSDLELSQQKAKNKTHETLSALDKSILWEPVESRLLESYPVGKKKKGPQAYSPIILFKCLLLRNWFSISSDTDLESLINDRFSFKKFIGLSVGESAPDSSTFSRFRNRLTRDTYEAILSDISDQISEKNIIINMGRVNDIKLTYSRK